MLLEHSTYSRGHLKRRLYAEGLKPRACEECGQGEEWRGRRMALILDHINGVGDDNRLENLRIVRPNRAATLETHCGRNPVLHRPGFASPAKRSSCRATRSTATAPLRAATARATAQKGIPRLERRKVDRPPHDQLMAELAALNYSAVGRRYGVSDNAVRKGPLLRGRAGACGRVAAVGEVNQKSMCIGAAHR